MVQTRVSLTVRSFMNTDGLKNRHSCLHLKLHPHSSAGIGLFWKLDFREMMLIFGLMLLLLQTAACLEFNCRFNQKDPCYAALGHKLSLKMVDTSKYDLKIYKRINNNQDDPVCRVKNDKIKQNQCDLFNNIAEVTVINGTLIINRVIRTDSGNYTFRLEDSDGTETSADLQVNVEAPIGSVEVSISCSSNGMKSVSCSSDGDQLIYSWTLNGQSLMDGNTTIELNEETDGNIICSVKNHVSHGQKSISVQPCPGLEFNCRFNQADPCYAALGHKLSLKMVDTSEYHLMIQKRINNNQDDPVCRVKNDKIRKFECDLFNNIAEVTVINGILIINRVNRADSGNYTLTLDHSDGTVTSADLQVNVEAPIGSVNVSISCSSNGMKSVSCSSDGDQLIYSWTLNGQSLMDGNTTIELNEETDGNIICSVKNHVSHEQKSISVQPCPVCSESVVFVLVWSFQLMVLFGLLGGFHIYMRHTSGKKQEDQKVRMRRFREGHEHTAEDSGDQQQISSHL